MRPIRFASKILWSVVSAGAGVATAWFIFGMNSPQKHASVMPAVSEVRSSAVNPPYSKKGYPPPPQSAAECVEILDTLFKAQTGMPQDIQAAQEAWLIFFNAAPEDAIAWAVQRGMPLSVIDSFGKAFKALCGSHPERCAELLELLPRGWEKSAALNGALNGLQDVPLGRRIQLAAEFCRASGADLQMPIGQWVQEAPAECLRVLASLGDPRADKLAADGLESWGASAPDAAFSWVKGISSKDIKTRDRMMAAALRNVDAHKAAKLLEGLSAEYPSAFINTVRNLGLVDGKAAIELSAGITDPVLQNQVWLQATRAVLERNPSEVAAYAEQAPNEQARARLYHEAAIAWAARSPEDALKWAEQLTSPSIRSGALTSCYNTWLDRDEAGALRSISELQGTPELNAAVSRHAAKLGTLDASRAVKFVQCLPETLQPIAAAHALKTAGDTLSSVQKKLLTAAIETAK
jgi:hypothetical protein